MQQADDTKKNPESKYDALIYKQNCVNDTVSSQVKNEAFVPFFVGLSISILQLSEAKEKLAVLTHSLKSIQVCGKGKTERRWR